MGTPPSEIRDNVISVIICTRNRAAALRSTLAGLEKVEVPHASEIEVIVVDNGSTDSTRSIVEETIRRTDHRILYIHEDRPGKVYALRSGIRNAVGRVLLFTDDDVEVDHTWIVELSRPLLSNEADAVAGGIRLCRSLHRSWLDANLMRWLAWCEVPHSAPPELIGANMGLRRDVFVRVPIFDVALGPGAAGLGEDTLLGWLIAEAGYRVVFAPLARVTHRPDPARLQRGSWLEMAKSQGRKEAYLLYHWHHKTMWFTRLRQIWLFSKLAIRRRIQPPAPLDTEGCQRWEMSYVGDIEMCRYYRKNCKGPRRYSRQGGLDRRPEPDKVDLP
jgi:glucosyl-dolichyl phosphate glucuronosyltransferase